MYKLSVKPDKVKTGVRICFTHNHFNKLEVYVLMINWFLINFS